MRYRVNNLPPKLLITAVALVAVSVAVLTCTRFTGVTLRSVGAIAGLSLLVWVFSQKRNVGQKCETTVILAEHEYLDLLSHVDMQALVDGIPDYEDLYVRYLMKTMEDGGVEDITQALACDTRTALLRCPEIVVRYLLVMGGSCDLLRASDMLNLASWCESHDGCGHALAIYALMEGSFWDSPDLEIALYRSAELHWYKRQDNVRALQKLDTLFFRFPYGLMMLEAEDLLQDIMQHKKGSQAA